MARLEQRIEEACRDIEADTGRARLR